MQRVARRTALACLSAVVAAGCASGAGGGPDAAQSVMMSAARSEAASTFHLSVTETMSAVSGSPLLGFRGARMQGDFDLATRSARLTGTLVGVPAKAGAAAPSLTFSVIQIGSQSWDMTDGAYGLGSPGHWVESGSASSSTNSMPDAAGLFDALKSKATQVRALGQSTVGGLVTEHYEMVGPPSLLDSLAGGSSGSQEAQPPGPVSVQVWVDRSNLIRRLTTTVKEAMPGEPGQIESVAATAEFTDYGERLQIQPPPADLVVPSP